MNVAEAAMAGIFGSKGGGDVTKEYVDTAIANAVADKVDKVEGKGLSTNDYTNVDKALVQDSPISSTSTTSLITDSADGLVQGINVKGHSHKNKNLLEITATTQTKNGVTFTVNSDRTVTIHGTASGNAVFQLVTSGTLSEYDGCIAVVDPTVYTPGVSMNLEIVKSPWTAYVKTGKLPQTINYNGNNDEKILFLRVIDGVTADTTFKPMICTVADYAADPTFEPYFEGIKSVGDDGLTVTTANSDNTLTTSAEFTTALPLRGVSDTVRDKLICTADAKQVKTVCGEVDLGTLEWNYSDTRIAFNTSLSDIANGESGKIKIICSKYQTTGTVASASDVSNIPNMSICQQKDNQQIFIKDTDYADAATFKTAMSGVKLVYELAEPVTTPLTDAEIAAFRGLRTYDNTTNVTISDEPDFELDYLKNTENGQAVADIQTDLQGQIDSGLFAETVLYDNMNLTVESAANVQCNLSQPYTNFDEIRIEYAYIYTGSGGYDKIFPIEYRYSVADLEAMRTSLYDGRKGYLLLNLYISFLNMYVSLDITSTSNLTINEVQKSNNQYKHYITKITGVKY